MVISALKVGLALDYSIVLSLGFIQLYPNPLPRGKHGGPHIPNDIYKYHGCDSDQGYLLLNGREYTGLKNEVASVGKLSSKPKLVVERKGIVCVQ